MLYPPSLPATVLSRSFRSGNGELGLLLEDAVPFLDACQADRVVVHGWELWVVNHRPGLEFRPEPAPGYWSGGVPMVDSPVPNIIHGDGDLDSIRNQVRDLDKDLNLVDPCWLPHIRINFTFD